MKVFIKNEYLGLVTNTKIIRQWSKFWTTCIVAKNFDLTRLRYNEAKLTHS